MYEFLRSANDILFYVVAAVAIIGGIIKIKSKKKDDKNGKKCK